MQAVNNYYNTLLGRYGPKKKNSLPPVNWRWVEEGDGYVGRLQPHGQPLGVGLPSGLQCLVPYPYRAYGPKCNQSCTTWAAQLKPEPIAGVPERPLAVTHVLWP